MAEVRRTLIPQFTLRGILAATAAMGVVSLAIGRAYQGEAWAWAIVIGLISGIVAFITYAATFVLAWLFSELLTRFLASRRNRGQKPSPSIDKSTAAIVLCVILAAANASLAGSGASITLPIGWSKSGPGPQADPNKSGLTLSINNSWVDSFGYRPLRVEIQSVSGPVKSDRVVTVRFKPMQGYTQNPSTEATQTLEIPAGGTSANMIIAVPAFGPGNWFSMDVFEDGRKIKELSIPEQGGWASWSGTDKGDNASPVTLLLDDATSALATSLTTNNPQIELMCVGPVDYDGPNDRPHHSSCDNSRSSERGIICRFARKLDPIHRFRFSGYFARPAQDSCQRKPEAMARDSRLAAQRRQFDCHRPRHEMGRTSGIVGDLGRSPAESGKGQQAELGRRRMEAAY